MATQADLDWENTVSKNQQSETRERRQAEREVKDRRKQLLQGASSTKERREIKAGVYDLNTRPDDNKEGADERIQNDGIDVITNPLDNSGGGGGGGGTFELDVVKDDNTAGRASFTGDGII